MVRLVSLPGRTNSYTYNFVPYRTGMIFFKDVIALNQIPQIFRLSRYNGTAKLDFAFNVSLASINISKVMRKRYYPSLSIRLLKNCLSNIYMLKRILSKSGMKPNRTFNTKLIKELFGIAAEAA